MENGHKIDLLMGSIPLTFPLGAALKADLADLKVMDL
jgi:hypothetical protein